MTLKKFLKPQKIKSYLTRKEDQMCFKKQKVIFKFVIREIKGSEMWRVFDFLNTNMFLNVTLI